jgi:hypothetical protein
MKLLGFSVAQPMLPLWAVASMDTFRVILGYLFGLPMNVSDVLTSAVLDPIAKIPELKVCAVGTEPTAEAAK